MYKHIIIFICLPFAINHLFAQDTILQILPDYYYKASMAFPFYFDSVFNSASSKSNANFEIMNSLQIGFLQVGQTDVEIISSSKTVQSENSIFISPKNPAIILNSNNSDNWDPINTSYGTSKFYSNDGGNNWNGDQFAPVGTNGGDPAVVINKDEKFFIGYINSSDGQSIAYSTDFGSTWSEVQISINPGNLADKNHLWVDNTQFKLNGSPNSYFNNLYSAWTDFGGQYNSQIVFSYSTNDAQNWSQRVPISQGVNALSHNQGVNLKTGPNGEVYACWAIYDNFNFPIEWHEIAIGFSYSLDGGVNWSNAQRIISNIKGIRHPQGVVVCQDILVCGELNACHIIPELGGGTNGKYMRTNSFPVMDVNMQTGEIFIVWTNRGIPGVNTGDPDIYMIKSSNQGSTWSSPIRVNQDVIGNSKDQWFPWIACDEITGAIVVIYYDSRDFAGNDLVNTYVSISYDNGNTWIDYLISDASWSGDPIDGQCFGGQFGGYFAAGYAGDYIGIDFSYGYVVPVWSDNRTGNMLAYTQPFCIPCQSTDLNLANATISTTVTHKFYDNITLPIGNTYKITQTGNVELQANSEILIEGEFESQGEFFAHIVHCDNSGVTGGSACRKSSNNKGHQGNAKNVLANVVNKPDFPASQLSNIFQCRIFPNPGNGIFKLKTINIKNQSAKVSLTNILGEVVYESLIQSNNQTIDISSYTKGIYFVKVQSNTQIWTDKIILQ